MHDRRVFYDDYIISFTVAIGFKHIMWQSEMCVARLARLFLAFAFFQIALVWPNAALMHSADFVQSVGGVWTSHEPVNLTRHWLVRLRFEIAFVTQGKVFVGRQSLAKMYSM